ncbi:MAG TPA: phospholipase D family protein [Rhodanobacteraceae bacterium]|nr:phospholipase D family protein [Rhodanobacteraceae bacterium]
MRSSFPSHARLRRLLALFVLCLAASGCATLRTDVPRPPSTALPPVADTPSTRYLATEAEDHRGLSGFRALINNKNALMSRIVMIDHAAHSLDLQYYIFDNDATGRLVAQRILAAADRGVRVRILLDDLDIAGQDNLLDSLDAHPNIEVRLFNPFRFRNRSAFSKAGQFIIEGRRLNRRMHNKAFIVDGMEAIVGGRNIGDAYFDFDTGQQLLFRDLDVIAIGPVVPAISKMFDAYWNSKSAFPVTAYTNVHAGPDDLARARAALAKDARAFAESDYAQALSDELPNGTSADRKGHWLWGSAELVADDPDKVDPEHDGRARLIGPKLKDMLDGSEHEALLISPYFIPGETGTKYLTGLVRKGITIKVLTNALAATDEPEVHAGYSKYRIPLLEAGIELFELRPQRGKVQESAYGTSSGESLHAKSMIVDGRKVFVGSMNLDPRSRLLNTEMGVIVDSPELAVALRDYFQSATKPENAFHVVLVRPDGEPDAKPVLRWIGVDDGKTATWDHDPETSEWTRMRVNMMRAMPIEDML